MKQVIITFNDDTKQDKIDHLVNVVSDLCLFGEVTAVIIFQEVEMGPRQIVSFDKDGNEVILGTIP
jgi:hypothetical protein